MPFDDPSRQPREALQARDYIAVAGTPWAAEAMKDVLAKGGNAFDAFRFRRQAALAMLNRRLQNLR